jgi:GNAT superfamily N-acetyltransferase
MSELDLRPVPYEHSDARLLIAEVQQEYVQRYGGPDDSPLETGQFEPPSGLFVLAYVGGEPVGTGAWRRLGADRISVADVASAGEIKRMYIRAHCRGNGYARAMLDHLEQTARAAGLEWLVLGTGLAQPEAISLYRSSGYVDVPGFGHYAESELAVHLGKKLH